MTPMIEHITTPLGFAGARRISVPAACAGCNFAKPSHHIAAFTLLLFSEPDDEPFSIIATSAAHDDAAPESR